MKYNVKYGCGHEGTVALFGPTRERERKLEWMSDNLCPDCYKKQQAKIIADKAATLGLPELTGSEKQVAWAMKIRAGIYDLMKSRGERMLCLGAGLDAQQCKLAIQYAISQDAASWWIDKRESDYSLKQFLTAVIKEMAEAEMETAITSDEAVTLEPKAKRTDTVCTVTATATSILVRSDKDDHIRAILKGNGFYWNPGKGAWEKKAEMNKASLITNSLLDGGVSVKTYPSLLG